MSGDLVAELRRRARTFERLARALGEEGDYDLAMFMAEQAAQLHLKAFFQEVAGYIPRVHGLRRLISMLAGRLEEAGFPGLAGELRAYAARRRMELVMLEDAYTMGRYGPGGYTSVTLKAALEAVEELVRVLEGVRRGLVGGRLHD